MDTRWFDNADFRKVCIDNHMEAMINGENNVMFVCPKLPPKDVLEKIKSFVPSDHNVQITEGLSMSVVAMIRTILLMAGIVKVGFGHKDNHHIDLLVHNALNMEGTEPDSPLWDKIGDMLKADEYTKTYKIIINGMVVRSGSKDETDFSEDSFVGSPAPAVPVKDDRFEYDRAYLPQDVATDVRILLETTNSVEEFLANI